MTVVVAEGAGEGLAGEAITDEPDSRQAGGDVTRHAPRVPRNDTEPMTKQIAPNAVVEAKDAYCAVRELLAQLPKVPEDLREFFRHRLELLERFIEPAMLPTTETPR
jgi:hypothetical protein